MKRDEKELYKQNDEMPFISDPKPIIILDDEEYYFIKQNISKHLNISMSHLWTKLHTILHKQSNKEIAYILYSKISEQFPLLYNNDSYKESFVNNIIYII